MLNAAFVGGDYEKLYRESRRSEKLSKEILVEFERDYPNTLKGENMDDIIRRAKQKRAMQEKDS